MADMVQVPASLLQKFAEAARAFEELEDELEDYLLSADSEFLSRMRQARSDHLASNVRPLSQLKAEQCAE